MNVLSIALLLLLSLGSGATGAADPIRWSDEAHTAPLFIPESVLQGTEPDPRLSAQSFWTIRSEIEQKAEALGKTGRCATPILGDSVAMGKGAVRWPSPAQKIQAGTPALLATVVRTVAGWSVPSRYPVSVIEVRIDEVLSDPSGRLNPGERLFFEQDAGTLTVGSSRLCTDHPRYARWKEGDRLLLLVGSFDEANPGFVHTAPGNLYPIREGKAYVQGPVPSEKPSSYSIESIREEVRSSRSRQ